MRSQERILLTSAATPTIIPITPLTIDTTKANVSIPVIIAKSTPMSFGTAFNNDFSRGVHVTPRCKRAGSHCKTLGAIRTDKETQNAPRARKAVFARLVKGA